MLDLSSEIAPPTCGRCGTQLAAHALACPACASLVHRERLQQLAVLADAAAASNDQAQARAHWQEALGLVPVHSQQHQQISARLSALADHVEARPAAPSADTRRWWTSTVGIGATVALLLAGKLKFLLLGLSKLSTVASMFGFIAVYWSIHGWPLAVGIAISIYVHEMGHVAMLQRLGIQAGAPLFIPGVGALVMLKQHVTDPVADARIGLAGPIWGLGATVAAWLAYVATGATIWLAISEISAFLNLFNLMPIWQLDGSRGFHALSRQQRWIVVAAIGLALVVTAVPVLWIVGAVALYRVLRTEAGEGHAPTTATFAGLVLALSWFARTLH
jgi:Zn-dependent protease